MSQDAQKVHVSIVPLVSTKSKNVFLFTQTGTELETVKTYKQLLKDRVLDVFSDEAKNFFATEGIENVSVWSSRISFIQSHKIGASLVKQRNFWTRIQFNPVN